MKKRNLLEDSGFMSKVLRHHPSSVGLTLDENGSVLIDDLAEALDITVERILEIAEKDKKCRFVISGERIWAAQGHSIPAGVPTEIFIPEGSVFHGTKVQFLDSILREGLKSGRRNFVHLSKDIQTAEKVAKRRRGESVLLVIDCEKMLELGIVFRRASNGVILVDHVPAGCFTVLKF